MSKKTLKVNGLGQCSLDHLALTNNFPSEDTKPEALCLKDEGGGPVATALVALSRLGVSTSFFGVTGDDEAGIKIKKGLKAEGVSIKGIITRRNSSSQSAHIIVSKKSGTRTVLWRRPTGEPLKATEVTKSVVRNCELLMLDGLMEEASIKAARLAKEQLVEVLLDLGRMRKSSRTLIKLSDHVIASERVIPKLGKNPGAVLENLKNINPELKSIVITLGKKGSIALTPSGLIKQDAFKVDVVDTTGAGDVFHAGIAYGVLKHWPIEKTLRFSSAIAALKCSELGGRSAIPTLRKTLAFMRQR